MSSFSKRVLTFLRRLKNVVKGVSKPLVQKKPAAGQTVLTDASENMHEATITDKLELAFDAAYYLSKNPDVLKAGMDPLTHFLKYGWKEGRRPNNWFNPPEYITRHRELVGTDTNPFLHFLANQHLPTDGMDEVLQALRQNQVLYFADKCWRDEKGLRPIIISSNRPSGEDLQIATKHFDAEYYISQNPDISDRCLNPLLHFMTLGWIEMRDPSPKFSTSGYLRANKDIRSNGVNPFVHFYKHGFRESHRSATSVADAARIAQFEDSANMQALVAQAKQYEPMVALPNRSRTMTSPLMVESRADVAQALRRKLAGKTYKYIVAVPHVRMSGASRVGSIFANALTHVRDPSEILVITTDSSEAEYIKWFSDKLDIFDLSKVIAPLRPEDKIRALVDMLRGVNCRTIINVNSRLVWDMMRLFGRQVHHEFRVVTYLFTSDETANGDRVGYPVQWLRDTADQHHLLLTDTKNLADDVSDRLGFDQDTDDAQVVPLYTPITSKTEIRANPDKPNNNAGHFLWAGRFDPQKRLDILVAIARANPDMTFDVYGKTVLGNKDLDAYNPPDNIIPKGTYANLQDVLDTPYTGFLYTAQWDGLPTILLDMAAAGLPIVASNVGGIAEMLDKNTGWLVDDFEDVKGYSAALMEMVTDPEQAQARVQALRTRLEGQFAPEDYVNSIKEMVKTYDL